MKNNVGKIDRGFRIILGILLLGLPFVSSMSIFDSSTVTVISVLAGAVMIATSAMKFCPLYRIIGVSTCKL